jgi:hypothetical protein
MNDISKISAMQDAFWSVIKEPRFQDMSLVEIVGVLQFVAFELMSLSPYERES